MSDEQPEIDERREQNLETARKWMTRQAIELQRRLEPMDAAGVLMGAACGVLEMAFGREKLIEYLLGLASEYEAEERIGRDSYGQSN